MSHEHTHPTPQIALVETGNVGVEVATEWLFSAPESATAEQHAYASGEGARGGGAALSNRGEGGVGIPCLRCEPGEACAEACCAFLQPLLPPLLR